MPCCAAVLRMFRFARRRARLTELLVVEEEERLVPAVEQPGNHDRAARAGANLILLERSLGYAGPIVEPGVRVEFVAPIVPVAAAVKSLPPDRVTNLICTAPCPRSLPASPSSR